MMQFYAYYPDGTPIQSEDEFVDFYSKVYYWENRDIQLEEEIKVILAKDKLESKDVITILRWKVGASNYDECECFVENQYRTIQAKDLCEKLSRKCKKELLNDSAKTFFETVQKTDGIGPTYAATLLFFISSGEYPIYDKYADIALEALGEGKWEYLSGDKEIKNFGEYQAYIEKLEKRFGDRYKTDRNVDCALWAYGHLFNKGAKKNNKRANSSIEK